MFSISCVRCLVTDVPDPGYAQGVSDWTFLTNHAHALVFLARRPDARLRDVAAAVGVTERTAQRIIGELVEAGYVSRVREGRRNAYSLNPELPLRHPLERDHAVGELLRSLAPGGLAAASEG